ncbi:MAG: 50S ribosomal protein L9 [Alphaproteobacteria bacterium]|nr:50S ribosomal protein L9 [Alphaproteobacteria bacterium]
MQIVLLERIPKLGQMGDVVSVKPGYARNFLLPQNKALRATKANMERFEKDRAEIEARDLDRKTEAEAVHKKLDGMQFTILRQSSSTGQLYGSVTSRDVVQLLADENIRAVRGQINIESVKILGIHKAVIALHPEVLCTISLNVARTDEEATRQAKGEVFTADGQQPAPQNDEIVAEEVFEEGHEVDLEAANAEIEVTPEPVPAPAPKEEEMEIEAEVEVEAEAETPPSNDGEEDNA